MPTKTVAVAMAVAMLIALAILAGASPAAWAAKVFKCEGADGVVSYQASPCTGDAAKKPLNLPASGRAGSAQPAADVSNAPVGARTQCTGKEMSISFQNMPMAMTLGVIADFSGRQLVMNPPLTGSGPVQYSCTHWENILNDLGARHGFGVRVTAQQILIQVR